MDTTSDAAAGWSPSGRTPGLCILLVEDDEADAYLIQRALWDHPAVGAVVHVRDGVEALAAVQFRGLEPDLAFIDLRMPRMGGLDLLAAVIKCADLTFPMVVLTSSSAPSDLVRGRVGSGVRVLIKPDTIPEMSAVLKGSIEAVWRRSAGSAPRRDPARISHQVAARESVRSAEAVRTAAGLARIGGWEVDFVTQRTTFSPELCELVGALQSNMSIAEANTFWADEDRSSFSAALEQAAERGERLVFEGRSLATDGSFRFWRLLGEPVLLNADCVAMRGVAQDVTEWLDVMDREAAAARTAEAMSGFLAAMSHELRTPLNGVLGMAQAMELDELPEQQRERLNFIETSGEALLVLLNDLLDFSKIGAGKVELEDGIVETRALADAARSVFAPVARAKGLDLNVSLTPAAEGGWRGDPARVRQVLYNLVSNALKFTHDGAVSVAISSAGGRLQLRVQDTGIGIAEGRLSHVFDRFVQADASITRQFGGLGLGLTIARDLARMMGGDIEVDSQEGRGSTFVARLPLKRQLSFEARDPDASAPQRPAPVGLRVLAAEDNPVNQKVLTALLDAVGIELTMAANGEEALEIWRTGYWDVVLMDIQMPVMDGMAATKLIRAAERREGRERTPIIAVTATAVAQGKEQYLAAGMDEVVAKPISLTALLHAIDVAIGPRAPIEAPACAAGQASGFA